MTSRLRLAIPIAVLASTALAVFITPSCKENSEESGTAVATSFPQIPVETVAEFSGQNAFDHVEKLTSFGPRPPESEPYEKSLTYLEKFLGSLGWKTTRQTFKVERTPIGPVNFTNLLARYSPDEDPDWNQSPPIVIGSHLDTKLITEFEFLGANDSGSSTGVLAEIARVLSAHGDAARNVELVFFDGEEAFLENILNNDGLYGSRYYAGQLNYREVKPKLGMVLDIVGDPELALLIGGDSHKNLKAHAKHAAQVTKISDRVREHPTMITDDQVPLRVRANLPVLHIIGEFMKAGYKDKVWHQAGDTLDRLTPGALEDCGRFTMQILHQLTAKD